MIGQGLAKIASGMCGVFPVSGSFSRSALNLYVGAKTGWSTLFACACVVACLLWATPLLYHLPRAVLAAIIIVPVLGLIDVQIFVRLYQLSRIDGVVATLTFVVTLVSVPYLLGRRAWVKAISSALSAMALYGLERRLARLLRYRIFGRTATAFEGAAIWASPVDRFSESPAIRSHSETGWAARGAADFFFAGAGAASIWAMRSASDFSAAIAPPVPVVTTTVLAAANSCGATWRDDRG